MFPRINLEEAREGRAQEGSNMYDSTIFFYRAQPNPNQTQNLDSNPETQNLEEAREGRAEESVRAGDGREVQKTHIAELI